MRNSGRMADAKIFRSRRDRSSNRSKQEYMSGAGMNVVIHIGLSVFVQLRVNHAESHYLPLIINRKCSCEDGTYGQIRHQIIQVNNRAATFPEKGPCTKRAARLTDHLAKTVDSEGFAVAASLQRADRLHAAAAGPEKCANSPEPFRRADHFAIVADVIGTAAGIAR